VVKHLFQDSRYLQIDITITDERILSALTPDMWRWMLAERGWSLSGSDDEVPCEMWSKGGHEIVLPANCIHPEYPEKIALVLDDVARIEAVHPFTVLEWLEGWDDIFIYLQ
jgi:hypothetical protein